MPWFKVDDNLAFHRKTVAAGTAAMGLWVRAGSWSAQTMTDGFVPEHMIPALSDGDQELAKRLVDANLWDLVDGGYQFHEWDQRQPTRSKTEANREAKREAGRSGGLKSGEARRAKARSRKTQIPTSDRQSKQTQSTLLQQDEASRSRPSNSRPDPTRPSGSKEPGDVTAATLVAEWIDRCQQRPPGNVIGQVSKHIKAMLDEHIHPDHIRRGIADWMTKDLHPSTLPSKVNSAMNARNGKTTLGDKAVGWLEFAGDDVHALPGGAA